MAQGGTAAAWSQGVAMSGSPWYAFGTKIREQGDRRTLPDRRMYKSRRVWERSLAQARGQLVPWTGLERRRRVAGAPIGRRVGQRRRGARRDSELLVRGSS